MSRIDEDDPNAYSFLEEAAWHARRASRRLWAKGGYYDRKYPVMGFEGWPVADADVVPKERPRTRQWIKQGK